MIDLMTVLYTRWRFDIYTQENNFAYHIFFEKIRETLFTFKLQTAELPSF